MWINSSSRSGFSSLCMLAQESSLMLCETPFPPSTSQNICCEKCQLISMDFGLSTSILLEDTGLYFCSLMYKVHYLYSKKEKKEMSSRGQQILTMVNTVTPKCDTSCFSSMAHYSGVLGSFSFTFLFFSITCSINFFPRQIHAHSNKNNNRWSILCSFLYYPVYLSLFSFSSVFSDI